MLWIVLASGHYLHPMMIATLPEKQGFHAMSINGIRQNAHLSNFEKVATIFNIKDWLKIVLKTCESFATFPDLAIQVGLDKKRADIVFNRIKECVKRVTKK